MSHLRDPIYIAGPMTDRPDLNYPLFNEVANVLRLLGYRVENPADNAKYAPPDADYHWFMRAGLKQLLRCNTIVLLPDWEESRGAGSEHDVAEVVGMDMFEWSEVNTGWLLTPASPPAPARS